MSSGRCPTTGSDTRRGRGRVTQRRPAISRIDLCRMSQACQLGRLYQLFGLGSTIWEVIVVGKLDEVPSSSDLLEGEGRSALVPQYSSWTPRAIIRRMKRTRITTLLLPLTPD